MGGSEEIGGLMGHWMEGEYNNKKGFIFSGYLSLINPKIEIKDRWNCRIYSNSPQDGYSSDEYVFYADNSFITLLNAEGEEVVDSGSYEDKGSEIILNSTEKGKFSFYKIEKVLTTKEYKSIIEKEPTIGKRLEKAYESGGDPGKEETIFQCENMKDLEAN
ncbi:MAG: hypothetical protein KDK36_12705 [Leptospiraceae bacterium]|nr:hypothetical protein [Leptospiraceae bacterium]